MRELIQHVVDQAIGRLRIGFYSARATANRTFRRVDATADWGTDVRSLRRVSNPILDVVPKVGAKLAIISHDGVVELGAWIGEIFDDESDPGTVWIRADLDAKPGHLNLAATSSITIRAGGTNDGVTVDVQADGTVLVDGSKVVLGEGAINGVLMDNLLPLIANHSHVVSGAAAAPDPTLTATLTAPNGTYNTTITKAK